jgi:hypothetical protein
VRIVYQFACGNSDELNPGSEIDAANPDDSLPFAETSDFISQLLDNADTFTAYNTHTLVLLKTSPSTAVRAIGADLPVASFTCICEAYKV